MMPEPLLLIEILSVSSEAETRSNIWAYTTIPSVTEILAVRSTRIEADLLRRDGDGNWPKEPEVIGPDGTLTLRSIAFGVLLAALCASVRDQPPCHPSDSAARPTWPPPEPVTPGAIAVWQFEVVTRQSQRPPQRSQDSDTEVTRAANAAEVHGVSNLTFAMSSKFGRQRKLRETLWFQLSL
jgi:hypothetical protein